MSSENITSDQLITKRFLTQEKEIEELNRQLKIAKSERQEMLDILTFVNSNFKIVGLYDNPMSLDSEFGFRIKLDKFSKSFEEDKELLSKYIYFMKQKVRQFNDKE